MDKHKMGLFVLNSHYSKQFCAETRLFSLRLFVFTSNASNYLTFRTIGHFPKGIAANRHLINEIVLGEESDVYYVGN